MKQFKLIVHHPNFSEEDLIINNKDFSSVAIDDVVEIYHPEDEVSRLLLQVTSIREDFQQKDTISVKQSVANAFQLRTFANVYVNIVKFKDVVLDSIELTFKDQYLGRGDMWRLKKNMENTCVYLNKKIEFCGIRCEVYEMWAQGERVACGTISEDTKIVFRSSTSQVYLFIQLSSEMWDMDISGDLYFEKAVNGFLTDLFYKWKRNGSNHEVTIVLFSRTFYEAQSIEEFPAYMRGCLQLDYKGRFYEDFYRVAVQNERYDDWSVILYELKKLFNGYPKSVLDYHKQEGVHIPKAVNSTAAQGNFLEVLNMSLNVFEKHYLDRSFERTGQLSVVITPGVGVFEVDRELTNITKQRIIDNGVGSDLVCLGEQPLHAVPLFKFHNKNVLNAVDDYSMPHWINLSFYSSSKLINYSSFVPRIKLPQMKTKTHKDNNKIGLISRATKQVKDDDTSFPFVNYDAYDAQVFKLPTAHISGPHHTRSLQRTPNRKRSDQCQHFQPKQVPPYRKFSEADITLFQTELSSHSLTRSPAISIPVQLPDAHSPVSVSSTGVVALEGDKQATPKDNSGRVRHVTNPMDEWEEELSPPLRTIVGSAGSPYSPKTYRAYLLRPGRALINPFDPSHVTIKLTSNRRRWTHVFPLGPTGIFMQQHHYQAVPQGTSNSELASSLGHEGTPMVTEVKRKRSLISHRISESEVDRDRHGIDIPGRGRNVVSRASMYTSEIDRSLTLLWGATGEQEWTPALTTGVDWKSLTIPACLPLTTDYFPDRRSLQNDYLISDYTLLPEDVALDIAQRMGSNARPLSTVDVFEELISQRLQQGFQQIVLPKLMGAGNIGQGNASPQFTPFVARSRSQNAESMQEYFLSIGRIFHKVTLVGSTITVTCFRPRHPYPMLNIQYQYRFQAPDMDNYEVSWVNFMSEKLESFNWNYLDHYVCWRGQGQFNLIEVCSLRSLKYWRFRVFLIPYHTHATRKQFDDLENYYGRTPLTPEREMQMIDNFLRIIEVVNKIRKPFIPRKPRKSGTFSKPLLTRASQPLMQTTPLIQGSAPSSSQMRAGVTAVHAGPFRDRVGSNRLHDRPRMHSGPSKMIERVRCESGNGGRISPAGEIMDSREVSFSSQSLDAGTDSVNESCGDDISTGSSSVPATPELRKFSVSSPRIDIIEGMKQQPDGLVFLSKQQGTPSTVFISADAAAWIVDHVEGAGYPEAMDMLEDMLSNGVICHASGCEDYPMIYGFHLYYFVSNEKELDIDSWQPSGDLAAFQSEWLEVSVRTKLIRSTVENVPSCYKRSMKERDQFRDSSCTPKTSDSSLSKPGRRISRKKSMYKECNISLEPNEKLARTEWGHQRYHHAFVPGNAFEISMNWMVATNSMISELLQSWNRKATSFNFQLAPVPNDPFALPFSYKSDPLRAPIFIPLNMDFLVKNFSVPDQISELIKFQEKIADHFGFISCVSEQDNDVDSQNYYIHISGYMFLMIPTRPKELQGICIPKQNRSSSHMSHLNVGSISSPHEEYITRHVMGKSGKCVYEEMDGSRIGFLLSWNHMFTKRWKSQTIATADDIITNKTFKDIRALCSDEYLLQTVWEDHLWEEEV